MRVIVCGGRDVTDRAAVELELARLVDESRVYLGKAYELVIIHGDCATGADRIADTWCLENQQEYGIKVDRYPADWAHDGKAAGPIRNTRMAQAGADLCVCFWNGLSKGSADMISKATRAGIPVRIVPMVSK